MKTTTTPAPVRNTMKFRTAVRAGVSLDASLTTARSRNFSIAAETQATY